MATFAVSARARVTFLVDASSSERASEIVKKLNKKPLKVEDLQNLPSIQIEDLKAINLSPF